MGTDILLDLLSIGGTNDQNDASVLEVSSKQGTSPPPPPEKKKKKRKREYLIWMKYDVVFLDNSQDLRR